MHKTAMSNASRFFECYSNTFADGSTIYDIGSQDVNGSIKEVCPRRFNYIGVDFADAKGVDVVIDDPYALPFGDASADMLVSSSCMEHSEFFWLLFNEMVRVLKPHGLLYINAPSNGAFHQYPVDCWRFYPDSSKALANWATRSGFENFALLESFTSGQDNSSEMWNDFVAVFIKDKTHASRYDSRIVHNFTDFSNGHTLESGVLINRTTRPEDQRALISLTQNMS